MRIPIEGTNGEALTTPATDLRHIMEDGSGNGLDLDGIGRVLELRNLVITNSHASEAASVDVYDSDESTGGAAGTKLELIVPAANTTKLTWEKGTGPTFKTNVTAAVTNGTIGANAVQASGDLY